MKGVIRAYTTPRSNYIARGFFLELIVVSYGWLIPLIEEARREEYVAAASVAEAVIKVIHDNEIAHFPKICESSDVWGQLG